MDFMEREIRGRKPEEVIRIDEAMIKNRRFVPIPIADKLIKLLVPDYKDYFIMKIVSARASDIRNIASLIHENGVPSKLERRIKEILPRLEIFQAKLKRG